MPISKTVVINCAGVGSRLGLGITKALIEIEGKPLISWQLEMLKDVQDVRIVVGFQADQVIDHVLTVRKDVTFVFNHDYLNTGTGASLSLGAKFAKGLVISLDGDLLVHPRDFKAFLDSKEECIGYCDINTEDPVLVNIVQGEGENFVTSFSRTFGNYEWSGLVQIDAKKLEVGKGHVYEIIEGFNPMKAFHIRCQEIDTPLDYDAAFRWVRNYLINKAEV
ncbi:NTP transferase domain-containing protein [Paenibacillus silvae]|uniref:phosphocholine cytidylyltransferase family protein n=1 Tax=Paenibacillus silvae TaxID=1325358 RepID=UPI003CF198F0